MSMRTATTIEASSGPWRETVDFAVEAEKLGLDVCWVAEAWGSDAVSALGFLAARTDRLREYSSDDRLGMALARAGLLTDYQLGRLLARHARCMEVEHHRQPVTAAPGRADRNPRGQPRFAQIRCRVMSAGSDAVQR